MISALALLALVATASASYGPVHHGYASSSQYHEQSGYGQYKYGYAEPNAVKTESKDAHGIVRGSYAYTAPDGKVIKNNYVADAHGFRSNLAPTAPKDFSIPAAGYAPYPAVSYGGYAHGPAYGGYAHGPAYGVHAGPAYGGYGGHAYKTVSSHPAPYYTKSYVHAYPSYGY